MSDCILIEALSVQDSLRYQYTPNIPKLLRTSLYDTVDAKKHSSSLMTSNVIYKSLDWDIPILTVLCLLGDIFRFGHSSGGYLWICSSATSASDLWYSNANTQTGWTSSSLAPFRTDQSRALRWRLTGIVYHLSVGLRQSRCEYEVWLQRTSRSTHRCTWYMQSRKQRSWTLFYRYRSMMQVYRIASKTVLCYPLTFETTDFYMSSDMTLLLDNIRVSIDA